MKPRWAFLFFAAGALLMAGCTRPLNSRTDNPQAVVEGTGGFPESLAGHWKASQHGWEFQIEPDGRISSAVISLGRVRVVPGKTTTMPTRSGSEAVFTPGLWTVHYAPATKELTVKIVMDHIRVEMAGNIVEGSSTDVFVGPASSTKGTWQTQWTTFTRYAARTGDNASVDLSTDPTYGETKPLTFERIVDQKP